MGELERGHGRFEVRDTTLVAVDTEVSPFLHIAQIVKCTRIHRLVTRQGESWICWVRLFVQLKRNSEWPMAGRTSVRNRPIPHG